MAAKSHDPLDLATRQPLNAAGLEPVLHGRHGTGRDVNRHGCQGAERLEGRQSQGFNVGVSGGLAYPELRRSRQTPG